jgi:hypothetical protein
VIKRALKLKDAIELYQLALYEDESLNEDYLTADNLLESKQLLQLLHPLKNISLLVQSDACNTNRYGGCHGTLWEVLPAVDHLTLPLQEGCLDGSVRLTSLPSLSSCRALRRLVWVGMLPQRIG